MPGPGRREAGRVRLTQLGSRNNLFDRCVMGTGGSEREPAQEGCPCPRPRPRPSSRPPAAPRAPRGPGCRGGRHLASPGAVPRGSRESLGEGRSPARGARRRVRAGVRSGRGAFSRALRRRCRGGAVHLQTEEIPGSGLRGARPWSLFPAAWRRALGGCCAHFLGPHEARVPLSVCCVVTGACAPLEAPARPRGPAWGLNFSRVPRGLQRISLFCCLTVGARARFLNLKGSPVKSACRLN